MLLFAPKSSATLASNAAACPGTDLAALEERDFEGGEQKTRLLVSVRGGDVYVLQSLHGGPDKRNHHINHAWSDCGFGTLLADMVA
jgi:ribose-phosphate pyrophosphokinase